QSYTDSPDRAFIHSQTINLGAETVIRGSLLADERGQRAPDAHRPGNASGRAPAALLSFAFEEFPFGFNKRRFYTDGLVDDHPLIFPNILRQGAGTHIR